MSWTVITHCGCAGCGGVGVLRVWGAKPKGAGKGHRMFFLRRQKSVVALGGDSVRCRCRGRTAPAR
eukprot:7275845-Prymnesium_polylepis.1